MILMKYHNYYIRDPDYGNWVVSATAMGETIGSFKTLEEAMRFIEDIKKRNTDN